MRNLLKIIFLVVLFEPIHLLCQGVADTLDIQGLNQFNIIGAKIRGKGGTSIGENQGPLNLFYNPALMVDLKNFEISIGGRYKNYNYKQDQDWYPNRLYAELSLIFENEETVVTRPFDDIKPYWSKTKNSYAIEHISIAVPSGPLRFGVGIADVIDLNRYFQNNNALDPNIGQFRPEPVPRVQPGESLMVNWFQFFRSREGNIYGVFGGISYEVFKNFAIGLSISYLFGRSNDFQKRADRGLFTFKYNNVFELDSVAFIQEKSGRSNYKGYMLTIGLAYVEERYKAGIIIKPLMKIKRSWSYAISTISGTNLFTSTEDGSDEITFAPIGSIGFSLKPSQKLEICFEYSMYPHSSTKYRKDTLDLKPWLSSNALMFGVVYKFNFFEVNLGYREDKDVVAPVGSGLMNKPIEGSSYSVGLRIPYGKVGLNISIDHTKFKYNDIWLSNVNYNERNNLTLSVNFEIKI